MSRVLLVASIAIWPLAGHAADYLANAQAALRKGDLKTAQIELRNAVRSDPQNANARFLLAKVQLELGDPAAAEQQAREAETRGYDRLQTTPLIGQAMLMQNHTKELLASLKPEGKDKKLDAEILVDRGAAQIALGDVAAAAESWHQAEQLDPNNEKAWLADARLALAQHDVKTAEDRIDHALSVNGKSVEARVLKAQILAQNKDVGGALKLLDQVIADSPPAIPARLARANMLIATGKLPEAKADDDAVLALLPGNVEALYLKAVLLHEARDDQAADTLLTRLAPVFDRMPRGWYLQALVKEGLGQSNQAEAAIQQYVGHVPDDPGGVQLLARIEFERGRPDLAVAALNRLVAAGHADVQTYALLGRANSAAGNPQAAEDALRKADAMAPDNAPIKAEFAGSLLDTGHPDQAVQQLERALELDPKRPQYGEALFLAALKTGDPQKPVAELAKIKTALGDTSLVQNLDGLLKQSQLDLPGARAEFEAIIQKDPGFMPAKINLARVLAMQGDEADYEKLLGGILDKAPASEPALSMLTQSLIGSDRMDQALALVERAHAASPKDLRLSQSLGDLYIRAEKPQKALDLVAALSPKSGPEEALMGLQAAAQLALKQTDQARSTLTQIVNLQPRNLVARRQLVALLVQAKDYEEARNQIKAGMAALPDNYQLYLDYALIDLKASGMPAALATADTLYSQNRTFAPALALKGDLYMANNQPADAAKAYEQAAATAPSASLTARTAGALQRAGKPDEAETVLKDWFTKHPDDVGIADILATLDISRRNYAEAKVYLQAILAKEPHQAAALNNLAWVDQQLGVSGAKGLAQQAYLLGPSPQTADTLGWILTTGGEPGSGLVLLRQANAGSDDPRIAYHYAVALKDTGQKKEAVKLLQTVAAAQGDFDEKTQAQHLLSEMTKGS
ncbi:MAG: XrtA/PEP-CTERM system TPR-repeat protein PrsT [Acetobacteraceae bacterium]